MYRFYILRFYILQLLLKIEHMAFVCNNLISQIWIQYSHPSASTITNWHLTNTGSSHAKQVLEQHQLAVPVAWKENMMQIVAKRYRISPGTYCHALTNIPIYINMWPFGVFLFFGACRYFFIYFFANVIRPSPQSWIPQIFSNFFHRDITWAYADANILTSYLTAQMLMFACT